MSGRMNYPNEAPVKKCITGRLCNGKEVWIGRSWKRILNIIQLI
jgi:hypothetical protein